MELKIISPTEGEFPQVISFNNEEIKKELALSLQKYEGLIYTEDNIKTAKTDRATLNKFKDAIEKKRKEIKKQCLKPYEDFEAKVKEITALVDKPILAIDSQVKAFEERQKQRKRELITEFYQANIGDLADLLPLERIWNEKWLNATTSMKSIETEITTAIDKVSDDLEVISGLKSEFVLQIKDVFLQKLDLSAALQEKNRLEEQKARLEEYQKAQAEKVAEQAKQVEPVQEPAKDFNQEVAEPMAPIVAEEPVIQQDFRVWVTKEQLANLKQFLLVNGIKYGRVM